MKLLFLNHNYVGYGTYWRTYYLGKYLSEIGNKVTMICASGKNFDVKIRKEMICKNFLRITLPRVKYSKFYTGQEFQIILNLLQTLLYRYDIIHCFTVAQPQIGLPGLFSKIFRHKKLVVDWDDLWKGGFAEYHPYPVKKVLEICESNIPKFADKITVVSEFLKKTAINLGMAKDDIVKIPNGANIETIKPLSKNRSRKELHLDHYPIIVAIGHTYYESLNFLLDSFKKVIENIPTAKLVLVGKIDLTREARNRTKKLYKNLIFTGAQPFKKIPLYLSAADILVLPMENSLIDYARFPIRLGDYLASGRPIVSNAVGEVKNILEKCGLVSSPKDKLGFSENIIRLIADTRLRDNLGKKARMLAETKLSWQKVATKLQGVYEGLEI